MLGVVSEQDLVASAWPTISGSYVRYLIKNERGGLTFEIAGQILSVGRRFPTPILRNSWQQVQAQSRIYNRVQNGYRSFRVTRARSESVSRS